VAAIAVAAVALTPLLHAGQPSARATRPAPATGGPPGVACHAPGGAECRLTDRYAGPAPARGLTVHDPLGSVTVTGTSRDAVSVTEQLTYRGLPPEVSRSVIARSGTGSVTVRVPGDTSYAVAAGAGVGQVSISVPTDASSRHVIRADSGVGPVTVTSG
jgi:hypothetical protein